MERIGDIAPERVVAVRPEANLFPVDNDLGLAHGAVKEQDAPFAVGKVFRSPFQSAAVAPFPHIRKTSGAACLDSGGSLPVLDDCHFLQVVVPVERSVYGPVMRYANLFPAVCGGKVVPCAEFPVFEQLFFPAGKIKLSLFLPGKGQECKESGKY